MADDAYTAIERDGVWGVYAGWPVPSGLPSWVEALPLWQWYEIPNTALSSVAHSVPGLGAQESKINAWCGASLKTQGSVYMLGAAGGHADYAGNEVNAIQLNAETPTWTMPRGPTPAADVYDTLKDAGGNVIGQAQFYKDLRPAATHTYNNTQFHNGLNKMLVMPLPGLLSSYPPPPADWPYMGSSRVFSYDVASVDWDKPDAANYFDQYTGSSNGFVFSSLCVKHQVTEEIFYSRSFEMWKFNPAAAQGSQWTRLNTNQGLNGAYVSGAMDPVRNRFIMIGSFEQTRPPQVYNTAGTNITASAPLTGLGAGALGGEPYQGVVFDLVNDCYLVFRNTSPITFHKIDGATLAVSTQATTGTPPPQRAFIQATGQANGIHNAVQYVPELRGVVLTTGYTHNMRFMRTAL